MIKVKSCLSVKLQEARTAYPDIRSFVRIPQISIMELASTNLAQPLEPQWSHLWETHLEFPFNS